MGEPADTTVGWKDILTQTYAPRLTLISLGVWLHAADSLLVATMLPAIVSEIGGEHLIGWTVSLYEIGTIIIGAASGYLALRFGLRMPMVVAALGFAIGCAVAAISTSMVGMLIGRLIQGFGGGGLMALSFVAAGVLFPTSLMPRAIAVVSALWGMSAFLGPLVGGLFVEFASWRLGFWFFSAQGAALALWIAFDVSLPSSRMSGERPESVPWFRLGLLACAVALIAYAGVKIAIDQTTIFIILGLSCLVGFLAIDRQSRESRLLPRRPFNIATANGAALLMILCFSIATVAITAYGPLLAVRLHNITELTAGLIVACTSVGWSIMAVVVSSAPQRLDRTFIVAGMMAVTVSILGFLYSVPNGPIWLIAVSATLEGAGFGMAWTFILRQMTTIAAPEDIERVSSAIPTIQRLGYAIGAAYIGIVANAAGFAGAVAERDLAFVAHSIFIGCLPFAIVGLVAVAQFTRLAQRIEVP